MIVDVIIFFIIVTSSVSVLRLPPLLSPLSFQFPSVYPSSFTLEATPMPVEPNTTINATCTVNEIRPEPSEFYWMLGDTRVKGLSNSSVVNSTYDVLSVYRIVTHTVVVDDYDATLTCVLVMQNGEELRRSLQIDIIGVGKGMYIMIHNSIIHLCGIRIVYHCLILAHGNIYKWVKDATYELRKWTFSNVICEAISKEYNIPFLDKYML